MSILRSVHDRYWSRVREHIDALMSHEDFNPFAAEMIRYQLSTGGKRIRPAIVVTTVDSFGADVDASLPFAATVELIHNASLVHDDIQDRDTTRRGRPSAWVAFSTEQAINLGDLLFVLGFEAFSRMDVGDGLKLRVIRLTIRAIGELVDGQVYEFVLKEREAATPAEYFRLVSGKTGSLFRLAFLGGYALAGDGERYERDMRLIGDHMGALFQLRDDLLDAVGRKEGRPAGSDVAEGKIAFPTVHCLSTTGGRKRDRILEVLRMPRDETPPEAIEEILECYRGAGSIRAAMEAYLSRRDAILSLACLDEQPGLRRSIEQILDELEPPVEEGDL
jgi:geranylgeranyl diphosphate synthase type I